MAAASITARDNQSGPDLSSPPSTRGGGGAGAAARVFDVPLVRATAENLKGFGRPVRDFAAERGVDIVAWPLAGAGGWRKLVPGTGDEGGFVEDVFRNELDASGRVQLSVNVGLKRRYVIGWFGEDPAEAAAASAAAADASAAAADAGAPSSAQLAPPEVDRSFILTHEANYHPDGGQIIASRDGAPIVLLLAPKGDDVRPGSFRAFFVDPAFDGTVGVHIDAGTWHQPAFPVHEGAGARGACPTLDNRQGKVHACVAADFVREFGGYLRVPLTRAAIVDAAAAPPLAPLASPRLAYAILYVASVARSRQFYFDAFGLRAAMSAPPGDPAPTYCELETGSTRLALCAFELAASNFAAGALQPPSAAAPPANFEVGLVVPDVHAAFKRAVAAGAAPASEPKAKPWGQLVSYVRDLDGHLVELCS